MTKALTTAQGRLEFLADLAERHMLETITIEGSFLQLGLIEFVRSAAANNRPMLDLQADLVALVPRFHNVLIMAKEPDMAVNIERTKQSAMFLFNEIMRDAHEHARRQNAGGLN